MNVTSSQEWITPAQVRAVLADPDPSLPAVHVPALARWWVHNLVAHPLLVLWPRVGCWLHERTGP